MKLSAPLYLGLACLLSAQQALGCCAEGCFAVDGRFHTDAGCSGSAKQVNANYGSSSNCVFIGDRASVTLNNNGCGSSSADIHFFKTKGCPGGAGSGYAKARGGGGKCVAKAPGAAYAIVVAGSFSNSLCAHPNKHPNGVVTCGY